MYNLLLAIRVLDGFFLGVVILLQSGKGGGLAAMGGGVSATEGILAGRQATTVLTRATWTAGGIFMVVEKVSAPARSSTFASVCFSTGAKVTSASLSPSETGSMSCSADFPLTVMQSRPPLRATEP